MRSKKKINTHILLLIIVLATIAIVVIRFFTWGEKVNLDDFSSDYENHEPGNDTLDLFLPAVDEKGEIIYDTDDTTTIVCFGNAPFADDRDSKDNLANMIAAKAGATVYNCSVSGSYLAALRPYLQPEEAPMDIFNFYWLTHVAAKGDMRGYWDAATETMGDDLPAEAWEVYDTLVNLDFSKVDIILIMYDASDYLAGHEMYNDLNNTDILQFTGNLEAGIEMLHSNYPHIRIMVMSPAYAFGVDESGNYVSSDIKTYGWDVLSTYVIKEAESCMDWGVTFIDHIYGTITEDNASEYLTDNLHINAKGRALIVDRFLDALHHYDEQPELKK